MENERVGRVLAHIETKFLEIGRLIQNEEYANAFDIALQIKRNLLRIRRLLSNQAFTTMNQGVEDIKDICGQYLDNDGQEPSNNFKGYQAEKIFSGRPGRPKLDITLEQLEFLMKERYTAKQMAMHFGCSIKLIYKKCYNFGLKFRAKYNNCTDAELHDEIQELHNNFPNSGSPMMIGYLYSRGKIIQRNRVRKTLSEVDPLGTACRWSRGIHRRTYSVPTPNSLWHIDAHLKLIRWKFAIHGCIDGYSRLIVYLKCNNSMTAGSVIEYFAEAISDYGIPSRVRSDHGYENFFVALLMNAVRGLNRGSHITGRSVHNQRIERLWVDVYTQVVDYYYRQFFNLEQEGLLNIENNVHMFALHKVYVRSINEKLKIFETAWNQHSIRTVRKTPRQLWISGLLTNMNSEHTATEEVFGFPEDLYTRVLQAFESRDMDLNVINVVDEVPQSNLTVQLNLSDSTSEEINRIILSSSEDREKYLQIILCLNN